MAEKASSLQRSVLRVKSLEALIEGFSQANLIVFYGSASSHSLAEILCCFLQAGAERDEQQAKVVFIDGGNVFDPYLISACARHVGRNPKRFLKEIVVARAFTCYQLATLVLEGLPKLLQEARPKLVVISDLFKLFNATDIERSEAKRIINEIFTSTRRLAEASHVPFLLTCCHRDFELEPIVFPSADLLVHVAEEKMLLCATILRHPQGRHGTWRFLPRQLTKQDQMSHVIWERAIARG